VSYFSRSSNAKLYMGAAYATSSSGLPTHAADSMREVPLLGAVTPAPRTLTSAFFNILNDAVRRAVGGKVNDKVWEGNYVVDDDEAVHNDFLSDSEIAGGRYRNYRVLYPNGRQVDFKGFVTNYAEEALEASDTPEVFRSNFTITQDGADTVTYA
jgi:hypothetical protein